MKMCRKFGRPLERVDRFLRSTRAAEQGGPCAAGGGGFAPATMSGQEIDGAIERVAPGVGVAAQRVAFGERPVSGAKQRVVLVAERLDRSLCEPNRVVAVSE
jgi:hypothetical protein